MSPLLLHFRQTAKIAKIAKIATCRFNVPLTPSEFKMTNGNLGNLGNLGGLSEIWESWCRCL